jgi:hypothetical protein
MQLQDLNNTGMLFVKAIQDSKDLVTDGPRYKTNLNCHIPKLVSGGEF